MRKTYYHRSNPKFDEAKQLEIVNEYKNTNKTLTALGEEFGCSTGLVHRIVKRFNDKNES
jgi:transposase-like protein